MNKFLLAIPALCDFITSTLQYIALNFIPGSVYQMMRGGTIVTTFLFSIVFLKSKVQKHQILGSALALFGVLIVGTSNMIFSDSSSGSSGAVIYTYILGITNYGLYFDHCFVILQWILLCFLTKIANKVSS